jgi:hypothetical protein
MRKTDKELLILLQKSFVERFERKEFHIIEGEWFLGLCSTISRMSVGSIITFLELQRLHKILDLELPKEQYSKGYHFSLDQKGYYERIGFLQTLIEKY